MRPFHLILAGALIASTPALPAQTAPQPSQPTPSQPWSGHLRAWVAAHAVLTLPQLLGALTQEPGFQQLPPMIQQKELVQATQLYKTQHSESQQSVMKPDDGDAAPPRPAAPAAAAPQP